MQQGLMELVFPVGSTYITQSDTNPSTILNFGTWERLKGKVCVGLDEDDEDLDTIGNTGGEKTHTLTEDEMPSHYHNLLNYINGYAPPTQGGEYKAVLSGTPVSDNFQAVKNAGGGQAHNNMQPYEVVGYMWIRRS